jgi:RNA polymerase sigma-70 factor, ECF subfamily
MNNVHLATIIENCKKGDKQAFKALMLNYSDYVFALAFRILSNDEDARDIVQETFIRVWKNLDRYNAEVKITTWIYKITTNLCLDKLKSHKRKPLNFDHEIEKTAYLLCSENLNDHLDNKQIAELINQMTENLTPKQKIVFVLKDIEGLESEEVEKITGMDNGQIKSNLYYARQQIKNRLIKIGYELH